MYNIPANTVFIGKKVHYLPSCHSTNDVAHRLIHEGYPNGCVVITDEQYAGKGQKGNSWETEPGQNLTFSILLYPDNITPSDQFALTRIVSLGITDFLENFLQIRAEIKWPNDIIYKGKKLAGILINTSISGNRLTDAILGIGLNVNQTTFALLGATSLTLVTGKMYNLQVILDGLLESIERRYSQYKSRKQEVDYIQRLYGLNLELPYRDEKLGLDFTGIIRGVDETGRIKIETENEMCRFSFKEVRFLSLE